MFNVIHHLLKDEKTKKYRDKIESWYIKKSDFIITVSEITKNRLIELELAKNNIPVISPGLELRTNDDEIAVKDYMSNNNILFVGSIEERKGAKVLINALKNSNIKDFKLTIIGNIISNEYYNELLKLIESCGFADKINFIGKISSQELNEYYKKAFVLIFPSFWEGYGMVAAEAMANGTLVICSRLPSLQEFIKENEEGLFFEPGNFRELTPIIENCFSSRDKSKEIAMNGYKKSKTLPTWEDTSKKYFDILEEYRKY